jgi:Holliday junction resolvase RusA-like endonuclease
MIEFFVPGAPVPAGSKRVVMAGKAGGPVRPIVTDDVDTKGRGRDWRAAVRFAAAAAMPSVCSQCGDSLQAGACGPTHAALARRDVPLDGPLHLSLLFVVPRPRSHRGKRGLLPSAPAYPTTKPDVLKLARAVEDACTKILWRDDAQIVTEDIHKAYADDGDSVGVRVRVAPLVGRRAESVA